jgi:hypothetical protein
MKPKDLWSRIKRELLNELRILFVFLVRRSKVNT